MNVFIEIYREYHRPAIFTTPSACIYINISGILSILLMNAFVETYREYHRPAIFTTPSACII